MTTAKPAESTADRVVKLATPEDVPLKNIARRFALGHLRTRGWYGCTIEGQGRTLFVVAC